MSPLLDKKSHAETLMLNLLDDQASLELTSRSILGDVKMSQGNATVKYGRTLSNLTLSTSSSPLHCGMSILKRFIEGINLNWFKLPEKFLKINFTPVIFFNTNMQ